MVHDLEYVLPIVFEGLIPLSFRPYFNDLSLDIDPIVVLGNNKRIRKLYLVFSNRTKRDGKEYF